MRYSYHKINIYIAALLVLLFACTVFCGLPVAEVAQAANNQYSNVIDDLQQDSSFDLKKYPAKDDDYSMEVLQIAESESDELFIYIYQPAANVKKLKATTINFSTERNKLTIKTYKLQLLNRNGVFAKYRVEGFKIRSGNTRFYEISAMHRAYDSEIDGESGTDNEINEIAIEVAQSWTVVQNGDSVVYSLTKMDVVTITHQWVGSLVYLNGITDGAPITAEATVSHFIGFSADYQIDKLMEADLTYVYYPVEDRINIFNKKLISRRVGNKSKPQFVTIKDDTSSSGDKGLFGHSYTWKNIRAREQFCAEEDLTGEARQNLKNDDWVLSFAITKRTLVADGVSEANMNYDRIQEVSILRLKFETEGQTYNLGVVSNKQTADTKPDNNVENQMPFNDIKEWFKENKGILTVVAIVLVIIGFILLAVLVPAFLPVLKSIFKAIGAIIAAPFKFINKKVEERKAKSKPKKKTAPKGKKTSKKPASKRKSTGKKKSPIKSKAKTKSKK